MCLTPVSIRFSYNLPNPVVMHDRFMGVMRIDELCDMVLDRFTPASIAAFRKVNRDFRSRVLEYLRSRHRINRALSTFFEYPLSFRRVLYECSALLSGKFALSFIGRLRWDVRQLDIYVPRYRVDRLTMFLRGSGYQYSPFPGQRPNLLNELVRDWHPIQFDNKSGRPFLCPTERSRGVNAIFRMIKRLDNGRRLTILIIESVDAAMRPILNMDCTIGMNILSHDRAYCAYPIGTFEAKAGLVMPQSEVIDGKGLRELWRHGWRLFDSASPFVEACFPDVSRWLDDKYSYTFDLCTPPNERSLFQLPIRGTWRRLPDPLQVTNWRLRYSSSGLGFMCFSAVVSRSLANFYIIHDESLVRGMRRLFRAVLRDTWYTNHDEVLRDAPSFDTTSIWSL
ncbi:hypothetical protein PUNSTDRAFT_139596 [Punctularia strigosozonata HHB-11173 SS5]|uniref:F-box domain-containing protein n=1 Tax=Punctularia strigosozonata (strain HHB-11173) TaxID=741275 RepID=R7S0L2_PUNST|nr:uncharacterized protein PUNSTDRAFT_139596 [Punctularia strigosozonata HHB-11173 SS5]EIN03389.1 hypothetical protein PUNSTDRAFT_139596 [Punctularia strigosozonata HHB-11173 SS5]